MFTLRFMLKNGNLLLPVKKYEVLSMIVDKCYFVYILWISFLLFASDLQRYARINYNLFLHVSKSMTLFSMIEL